MGKRIKAKNKQKKDRINGNGNFDIKKIKKLIKNELYSHYCSQEIKKENTFLPFYSKNEKEEKEKNIILNIQNICLKNSTQL